MGTTVIVASHLLEELEPICNRIGILHNHSIINVGTPDELRSNYSKNEEIRLRTSGKHEKIARAMRRHVKKIKLTDKRIILYTTNPKKTLKTILRTVDHFNEKIISLELSKPSLKEVFESVYHKK